MDRSVGCVIGLQNISPQNGCQLLKKIANGPRVPQKQGFHEALSKNKAGRACCSKSTSGPQSILQVAKTPHSMLSKDA